MHISQSPGHGEIIIGAEISAEEFSNPEQLPSEIEAVQAVVAGDIHEGIQPFVTMAREDCGVANCCLRALCRTSSQHVEEQVDGRDDSHDFPTMTIDVQCGIRKECDERVEALTTRLGEFVQASIAAKEEADVAAQAITDPVAEEANKILAAANKEAAGSMTAAITLAAARRSDIYQNVRTRFLQQTPVET